VLVLRGERYYLAHVGDTRVYRARGDALDQVTRDHTWPRRDMRHVVKRAVGLDSYLVADFAEGDLWAQDIFVMVSDGVWDVLDDTVLRDAALHCLDAQEVADELVAQAIARQAGYMGRNDATAVVVKIESEP
jgi:protein phosphatase